jgi:tight adherence protein B
MNTMQLMVVVTGGAAVLAMGVGAFLGPNPQKEFARRLQAVRFRHSENATDKVEAQLKKAVAARKPQAHRIAGSGSRTEALALRLHRTGMGWSMTNYMYVSLGLSLTIALLVFLKSGIPLLSLFIGAVIGLGLPHMLVNFFIKKRLNAFTTKFPDAIELLVRGLRSGLPVTRSARPWRMPSRKPPTASARRNSSSSASPWPSSARPAATLPRRCRTWRMCCANAPR